MTTNYTLDLAAGLTQVLDDGTNTYLYGPSTGSGQAGRISQSQITNPQSPEYFLSDALGSVRQLADPAGVVTLTQSYAPYGETVSSAGSGYSAYQYTGEIRDASGLTYLRARYYASQEGRFISRDTWAGNYNSPLSFNRWNYGYSNPVKYIDSSGHLPCPSGWDESAVKKRVDKAEKYVQHTSDPIDTYIAAGIAVQCAGWDEVWNKNSGVGIAQVSKNQAETAWGEPIFSYDIWGNQKYKKDKSGDVIIDKNGNPVPVIRGYGLRLTCASGELEDALNPMDTNDAIILMKRRIQLVLDECKGCSVTDLYIAAALAQNGPGFTQRNLREMPNITTKRSNLFGNPDIVKDWFAYFENDAMDGSTVNTVTQLDRFTLVTNELRKRRWILPLFDLPTIRKLLSY